MDELIEKLNVMKTELDGDGDVDVFIESYDRDGDFVTNMELKVIESGSFSFLALVPAG